MRTFSEKAKGRQQVAAAAARSAVPLLSWAWRSREVSSILRPPSIASLPEPVVARLDAKGGELQEEQSAALQHGLNPDEPVSKPREFYDDALREAAKNPPKLPPAPTIPGDRHQQERVLRVDLDELWHLPRIHDQMKQIAAETEARETENVRKFGGKVDRTEEKLMKHWEQRFLDSVNYIQYVRVQRFINRKPFTKEDLRVAKLHDEEEKLVKSTPPDLVTKVEALRLSFRQKWQQEVELAADRFVTLARNEALFATVRQNVAPAQIYGLPEELEGAPVPASAHPDLLDGEPVAPSVVVFIKELQRKSGLRVRASNYGGHERSNPWVGHSEGVGKYSFDIHLDGMIGQNSEGFFEREPLIKFFKAMEEASKATKISWAAIYNDFEVARSINAHVGSRKIYYSGGGHGPTGPGSLHHGPEPYILHLHVNIMPNALAAQYFAGKNTDMPHLDLGGDALSTQ